MDARVAADRPRGQGGRPGAEPGRVGRGLDRGAPGPAGAEKAAAEASSAGRGPRDAWPMTVTPGPFGSICSSMTGRCGCRRRDPVRRGQLERHRDRLDLRRPRHLQEVPGQDRGRSARAVQPGHPGLHRRRRSGTAGGWPAGPWPPATPQVEVPPLTTRPKAATVGVGRQVILRPAVQKRYLELTEPNLADQATDLERVLAAARGPGAAGRAGRAADPGPDAARGRLQGHRGGRRRRADRGRARRHHRRARFGIAFDLGTTTVVATLLDLSTGTPVAVESMLNKQQPFGADVITRISATMMDPGALDKLQQLAAGDPGRAGPGGLRAGRRRAGTRSTRSRWPATPP